jgi:MauM/NapG family ferredoxin protein
LSGDPDDPQHNRRMMFRRGLQRLLEPLVELIEQRLPVEMPLPVYRSLLRPPGALSESELLQQCYRCGHCVDACPANAIRPVPQDDAERAGTPFIDPDLAACVVCDELACMKACPSGTLRLVPDRSAIRMGMAEVSPGLCKRSYGEDCTWCVDRCPFGSAAIRLDEAGAVEVLTTGCVGCGVCQLYCPTSPKAIVIRPF